ncbi:MAG TPA: hypothetical protein VME22_14655 [Solirubrobacteraceae bacterium]|nr:hypothetical protein [Solirubrobacteraceae bacterium]
MDEIASMSDPVIRNLYITQGYHDLALKMGEIVGCRKDASWATFGCWASKTAGTFIRGQELPRILQITLKRHPELAKHAAATGDEAQELVTGISGMLLHPLRTAAAAFARISVHTALYIGEGNRVVFAELAGSFAGFIEAFGDGDLGKERLDELLAEYSDGKSEPDLVTVDHATESINSERRGGQGWLKDMLRTLHQAALTPDKDEKARLMLLASAYGGLHEQTRLQSYIERALGTAIDDVFIAELRSDAPPVRETQGLVNRMILVIGRVVAAVARRVAAEWSSRHMMTMPLPDETIRLGEDIRAEKDGPLYPAALVDLEVVRELFDIWNTYHPDWSKSDRMAKRMAAPIQRQVVVGTAVIQRQVVVGSAASNWGVFQQRMKLILAYFRTRQQCEALHNAPFTAGELEALARDIEFTSQQLAALSAGRLPERER